MYQSTKFFHKVPLRFLNLLMIRLHWKVISRISWIIYHFILLLFSIYSILSFYFIYHQGVLIVCDVPVEFHQTAGVLTGFDVPVEFHRTSGDQSAVFNYECQAIPLATLQNVSAKFVLCLRCITSAGTRHFLYILMRFSLTTFYWFSLLT